MPGSGVPLAVLLSVWIAAGALVLYRVWRGPEPAAGLTLAYVLNLAVIHWLGASIYVLPWYWGRDPALVQAGFTEATYALVAFAVGALVVGPAFERLYRLPSVPLVTHEPHERLPVAYIVVGLTAYFVLVPLFRGAPTVTALVAAAWNLVVVGLCLGAWRAWRSGGRLGAWVMVALALPFVTIVVQGFLGYGALMFLTVFAFLASFVRPRRKLVVWSVALFYGGLSLYVTYMGDRARIREVVWGGASLRERVAQVASTVAHMEWFDPYDPAHLARIDGRLNQNYLVGAAVEYLGARREWHARGETVWESLVALVPRAVWPEKPVTAGSPGLVTRYTGIPFAPGTSVGIGQVMEFYVNFGTAGVILGFLALGAVVAVVDRAAAVRLHRNDWQGFAMWFLPGMALLQVGGSLVEMTSSAAAAIATVYLVNAYLVPHLRGRARPLRHVASAQVASR